MMSKVAFLLRVRTSWLLLIHKALCPQVPSPRSSQLVDLWKRVWMAKVPGKVKIHIWKACGAILPTTSRLLWRRVMLDSGCVFCSEGAETIEHVCRDCPFIHAYLINFF